MTDFTTEVTVTIHGTEMDLVAAGERICPAEPDVGMMCAYIDEWDLFFADGTQIPAELHKLIALEEDIKVQDALDEALARGDFEPDPDILREDRDERRRLAAQEDAK